MGMLLLFLLLLKTMTRSIPRCVLSDVRTHTYLRAAQRVPSHTANAPFLIAAPRRRPCTRGIQPRHAPCYRRARQPHKRGNLNSRAIVRHISKRAPPGWKSMPHSIHYVGHHHNHPI